MQPAELSRLLGNVSGPTLRRWGKTYARFLSPGANPPLGKPRRISDHDAGVLSLVAALRTARFDHEAIVARLEAEEADHWGNLPLLLPGQKLSDAMPVAQASAHDAEPSGLPALRIQHQYLEQRNSEVSRQLSEAQARIPKLEEELERTRSRGNEGIQAWQQKIDALQTELQETKAQAALLKVQLSAYSLGREKPVNVAVLIAGGLTFGAALAVMLLLIVALVLNAVV